MEKEDWIYLSFIGAVVVLMGLAFWARHKATIEEDQARNGEQENGEQEESRELHKRRFEL